MQFNFAIVWRPAAPEVRGPPLTTILSSPFLYADLSCDSCCAYILLYTNSFSPFLQNRKTRSLPTDGWGDVRVRAVSNPAPGKLILADRQFDRGRGRGVVHAWWYAFLQAVVRKTVQATHTVGHQSEPPAPLPANVRAVWTPERCKQNL